MKRQAVIVAAALMGLAVEISAGNPPAAGARDDAVATLAAKQAEVAVLRSQLAEWEKVLAEAKQAYARYRDLLNADRDARKQDTEWITGTEWIFRSWINPGPIAAKANQAIGRADVAWSQIDRIKKRLAELEPQIAAAQAQVDRFNKPPKANAPSFAANADPRANEPPGGVKVSSGSGYLPLPHPGEKPGLGSDLPNWINTDPQSAGNTQTPGSGSNLPGMPGGPTSGAGWRLPPTGSPVSPLQPWPPYLDPWPTGGVVPGHGHTPAGKDVPSKSSGHKHGADGKDIR